MCCFDGFLCCLVNNFVYLFIVAGFLVWLIVGFPVGVGWRCLNVIGLVWGFIGWVFRWWVFCCLLIRFNVGRL